MTDSDYQKREADAVEGIKKVIPASLKRNMHPMSKGLFAELYENDIVFPNHYCACAIDGVGTKILLADALEIYDTVGIDLVAMSANDLITLGPVSPFLFINYLAVQEKIEPRAGEIIKGIVKGLEECEAADILQSNINVNMGKGETASVDEMISSFRQGYAFDMAGGMIGFVDKKKVRTHVNAGDKIIALKSSGPHSNGYTDLRLKLLDGSFETRSNFKKNYVGKHKIDEAFGESTIGETLLTPTRIYVKSVASVSAKIPVAGINNTGYGIKNLNRLPGNFEFAITDPIKPQPIFDLVQKDSGFSDEQMYKKFNMGQGFFIIANPNDVDEVLDITKAESPKVVGEVLKSDKKISSIVVNDKKIVYEGY